MRNRLRTAHERILAFWKWCLSFRKTDWSFEDYPIATRRHEQDESETTRRGKIVPYTASMVNWTLTGMGDTATEALADRERVFAKQAADKREKHERLPRPGTHVPIQFATRERVDAHRELAEDFIRRVLGLEWAWISDDSTLWDFHGDETNDALLAKTKEIYGVDIADIESAKLCEIFEQISLKDRLQRWR